MTANEKVLATFETRLRQMILRYQQLKKENEELYAKVEDSERRLTEQQARLEQQQHDYDSLKMAKMLSITDGDLSGAKERLTSISALPS